MHILCTNAQIVQNLQALLHHLAVLHGERHPTQIPYRHILVLLVELHLAEIALKLTHKDGHLVHWVFWLLLFLILHLGFCRFVPEGGPDFAASGLLNEVEHGAVGADILHEHAHVRVTRGERDTFLTQLPVNGQKTRKLILFHHKSVRPYLDQTEELSFSLFAAQTDLAREQL